MLLAEAPMNLARAMLCANCDTLFEFGAVVCPACGSHHAQSLDRLLNRRPRPEAVPLMPLDLTDRRYSLSPSVFFIRWGDAFLTGASLTAFADDLVAVVQYERDRLRRRLTTDKQAYLDACFQTANEVEEAQRNGG